MHAERRRILAELLDTLTPERRLVVIARDVDEIPMEDIATAHGIAVSTAYKWYNDARAALDKEYKRRKARLGVAVLPVGLDVLLGSDRTCPPPPDSVRERILRELRRTMDDVDDSEPERRSTVVPLSQLPSEPASTSSGSAARSSSGLSSTGGRFAKAASSAAPVATLPIVALLVTGIGAGAVGMYLVMRRPAEPSVPAPAMVASVVTPVETVASPSASTASPVAAASDLKGAPVSTVVPRSPASAAMVGGAAEAGADTLAADTRAFDIARTAFSRGDNAATLAALDEHARKFPRSQFAGQRERMWILTLVRAGKVAEARARVEHLRRVSPKSPLVAELEPLLVKSP